MSLKLGSQDMIASTNGVGDMNAGFSPHREGGYSPLNESQFKKNATAGSSVFYYKTAQIPFANL